MRMKKRGIVYTGRINLPKINYRLLIIFTLFLCGLIIGVECVKYGSEPLVTSVKEIFDSSRAEKAQLGYLTLIIKSFLPFLFYLIAAFVMGVCAAGVPFILMLPLFRGCMTGITGALMYSSYGVTGLGYCALIVYPGTALAVSTLIFALSESMRMSSGIFALITDRKSAYAGYPLKMYCGRYGIFTAAALLAAVIDAVLFKAFESFFVFG